MGRRNGGAKPRERSVEGLLRYIGSGAEQGVGPSRARDRRPTNSIDIAASAIKLLVDDDAPRDAKTFAKGVLAVWGEPTTAEKAKNFRTDPAHRDVDFFRTAYLEGLDTLAYAALVDLKGDRPKFSDKVGGIFSPDRKQAAELCRAKLTAAAGSLSIVSALDMPAPGNLRIVTYPDSWKYDVQINAFPTRLASYDRTTLREYADTLSSNQELLSGMGTFGRRL